MNELVAYLCTNCGRITYPHRSRCLNCRGREFEAFLPEGDAKLLTFTDVQALPWGIDDRYRILGVVEFENKVKAMGWVKADRPKLGMKLKAHWEPVRCVQGEYVDGLVLEPAK
jgi:uncharacterized OB-fold protein